MSFSTDGFSDGSTVFIFLSVITTVHGALILCKARAYSSEHLPLYCNMMRLFSIEPVVSAGVVDGCFSDTPTQSLSDHWLIECWWVLIFLQDAFGFLQAGVKIVP